MVRESFDRELRHLQDEILVLGSMVENALTESVSALKQQDLEAAQQLVAEDHLINKKRFEIEGNALILIATQQPMAGDLRTIAAVLEIAGELERMGDYAKGIANIALMIDKQPLLKPLIDIPRMAEKARDMLHRSLDAFSRQDVALARAIPAEDDEIDALYNQIYRELMTYVMADPRNIDQANHLLWVAHNLERTADRVTNICERVIFTVTGELVEIGAESMNDAGLAGVH
ncbi:MAG: phosphate signaling complex protein PhoU [Chloroflexi bacterium]|nr:phosphate signaling complex protein PhoU [Chloroflexota bacterium]MBU1751650.1 phosphate signaling complex protein PhoU [Chloroflexota bacterium]MBU1878484.1 phosphate signaling complex protein PhoU [Chloroflexota bacterium]